jgi:hypothetical protein
MATQLLGRSKQYTALAEKREALKARELELRKAWLAAEGDGKAQLKLSTELRATTAESLALGPQLQAAKEAAKVAGLQRLMRDPEYRKAITTAAEGLSATLVPWLPLAGMTYQARKQAIAAPQLPQSVGQMIVEGKIWLDSMIRQGVLDSKALPPALRSLVEEEK